MADEPKGPNVWGTPAARSQFEMVTLPEFKQGLGVLTFEQLKLKHDAMLRQIDKEMPGTRGWTEATIFEYAVREQLIAKGPPA